MKQVIVIEMDENKEFDYTTRTAWASKDGVVYPTREDCMEHESKEYKALIIKPNPFLLSENSTYYKANNKHELSKIANQYDDKNIKRLIMQMPLDECFCIHKKKSNHEDIDDILTFIQPEAVKELLDEFIKLMGHQV